MGCTSLVSDAGACLRNASGLAACFNACWLLPEAESVDSKVAYQLLASRAHSLPSVPVQPLQVPLARAGRLPRCGSAQRPSSASVMRRPQGSCDHHPPTRAGAAAQPAAVPGWSPATPRARCHWRASGALMHCTWVRLRHSRRTCCCTPQWRRCGALSCLLREPLPTRLGGLRCSSMLSHASHPWQAKGVSPILPLHLVAPIMLLGNTAGKPSHTASPQRAPVARYVLIGVTRRQQHASARAGY